MDIREPEITREQILMLKDDNFTVGNVCIVTGAGTGIGRRRHRSRREHLMTVGSTSTRRKARRPRNGPRHGRQMIFIKTDLCKDEEVTQAVADAAKLGTITFLANIAGLQHIDSIDNFRWKNTTDAAAHAARALPALQAHHPHMRKSKDGMGVIATWPPSTPTSAPRTSRSTTSPSSACGPWPSLFRPRRGKDPLLHRQHRFHQNPPRSQPNPGPGRPARITQEEVCATSCSAIPHQGNDGPGRGGHMFIYGSRTTRGISSAAICSSTAAWC